MSPLLSWALRVALGCLVLAMALALVRIVRGPTAQDRVLAFDCLNLDAMLVMLTLGLSYRSSTYFEAALLIALLGFVGVHGDGEVPPARRGHRMRRAARRGDASPAPWWSRARSPRSSDRSASCGCGTFFQRVHAPTLGVDRWAPGRSRWRPRCRCRSCEGQVFVHALLIPIFIALTTPVTTIFLMRAALFRGRVAGKDAPPPVR